MERSCVLCHRAVGDGSPTVPNDLAHDLGNCLSVFSLLSAKSLICCGSYGLPFHNPPDNTHPVLTFSAC